MKRRNFIQSTLIASAATPAAAVAAASGTRVYGRPASLSGGAQLDGPAKMMLSISRGGMPAEGWPKWSRMATAIVDMFSDEAQRTAFNANPKGFLEAHGFDTSRETLDAPSLALLVALSDPSVQRAADSGDYAALLSYLQASGALERPNPDELTKKIGAALNNNLSMIKEALGLSPFDALDADTVKRFVSVSSRTPTTADIAAIGNIGELIRIAPGQAFAGAFAVAVAAVSVIAGVQAAVVAFNYAAVVNAVKVSGSVAPRMKAGEISMFNGQISRMDPDLCDMCDVAQRASSMLGGDGLYSEHQKLVIRNEIAAFLMAMRGVNLVSYDDAAFDTIVDTIFEYGMRTSPLN